MYCVVNFLNYATVAIFVNYVVQLELWSYSVLLGEKVENPLVIKSKDIARAYIDNWVKHTEHSKRNEGM